MALAPARRVQVQHRKTSKKYLWIYPSVTCSLLTAKHSCIRRAGVSVVWGGLGRWGSSLIGLGWGI